jgi:RecB family exonuclease
VSGVLAERLRFLRREPPTRRYGRVFIGGIDEARGRSFSAVFLPGLAEGLFPRRAFEDPLLLDEQRTALSPDLAKRSDKVDRERQMLRIAAAAAREKLVVSYPRMDVAQSRPRVPSFYALELPRAVEGRLPELDRFEDEARLAAMARLNWPAPIKTADAIDDAEYDLAALNKAGRGEGRYLMQVSVAVSSSLRARGRRWRRKWFPADGFVDPPAPVIDALAGYRLALRPYSPTSLQQFAACPYKFYLHALCRLRPREEPAALQQLDPLTRGALFHEVQFVLFNRLRRENLLPIAQPQIQRVFDLADQALREVETKYAEKLAPAIERVWRTEIEDLRTDLRGWLQHVATHDHEWEPVHFEFAFGLEHGKERDAASVDQPAEILDGVRLRGSIDLVERNRARGVLRITDHKTGKPPDQDPVCVGGGKFLQPMLYALAAQKLLGEPVESGRLFYSTQRGNFKPITIAVDNRSRGFLGLLLKRLDDAIARGFLPAAPDRGTCEYCDFRPVCGPHEEARVRLKDKDRLEPLIDVRNML